MNPLKIAASVALAPSLSLNTARDVVTLDNTDFTDVAAVVVSLAVLTLPGVTGKINGATEEWQALEQAAQVYKAKLLPPFFDTLPRYVDMQNSTFACPGH